MHFAKCSLLRDKHSTKAKSLVFFPPIAISSVQSLSRVQLFATP